MKPIVLALVGPTGVGKTQVSLDIARALNAEILSMDSMQVYRGMDIGTAKSTPEERRNIAHYMIDIADPHACFTVADYREQAFPVIDDILSRGKTPMLVGGTGLYLDAIRYEMKLGGKRAQMKPSDHVCGKLRTNRKARLSCTKCLKQLIRKLRRNYILMIYDVLCARSKSMKHRVRPRANRQTDARREGRYHVMVYGLSQPREKMYARINARVDEMMADGLVEEVKRLLDQGVEPNREGGAMQAIGYKEIVSALRGDIFMERAVELIKQNSRRYAKRQWTWFRHDQATKWFDYADYQTKRST